MTLGGCRHIFTGTLIGLGLILLCVFVYLQEYGGDLAVCRRSLNSQSTLVQRITLQLEDHKHELEWITSQLQDLAESKLKLDQLYEAEKREHLKTKEELYMIVQQEKTQRDKENIDSLKRYNKIEYILGIDQDSKSLSNYSRELVINSTLFDNRRTVKRSLKNNLEKW